MAMSNSVVLMGGGSLAVEVAHYIADLNRHSSGEGREVDAIVVTDVISAARTRADDLQTVLRSTPDYHVDIHSVRDIKDKRFVVCIGSAEARWRVDEELAGLEIELVSIIHPTAYIAPTAQLSGGLVIAPFAFVGPFARIGRSVVLNTGVVIGHDVVIDRAALVSPGACINGNASCGMAAFLGSNATLAPHARLGHFASLSAGSVLAREAGDGFLMHGNPASGRQMVKIPVSLQDQP